VPIDERRVFLAFVQHEAELAGHRSADMRGASRHGRRGSPTGEQLLECRELKPQLRA
jgi:hypothetical protein